MICRLPRSARSPSFFQIARSLRASPDAGKLLNGNDPHATVVAELPHVGDVEAAAEIPIGHRACNRARQQRRRHAGAVRRPSGLRPSNSRGLSRSSTAAADVLGAEMARASEGAGVPPSGPIHSHDARARPNFGAQACWMACVRETSV
jgi:hypothetical protein